MESIVTLLSNHSGRDSVVRASSYAVLYLSEGFNTPLSAKLKNISKELSYCRVILRLFDDIPMLKHTLKYGFGPKESPILLRSLEVMKNILDLFYYPVEHVAWAADKQLLKVDSGHWWTIGSALWGMSCYINILISLIMMSILQKKTNGLKNPIAHERIVTQQMEYMLSTLKDFANLAMAIHFLPKNSFLWAGRLSSKRISVLGLISSFLRLVLIFRGMKAQSSK